MRFPRRSAIAFLLILLCLPWVGFFFKTAYNSSRAFQTVCLIEFLLSVFVSRKASGWSLFAAGFALAALPRAGSLILQVNVADVLFPVFLGLAAGAALRVMKTTDETPDRADDFDAGSSLVLFAFAAIELGTVRTTLLYYPEFPARLIHDRLVAPDITAAFAMYGALGFSLNLLPVLAWIYAERGAAPTEENARMLSSGIASGFLLSLLVLFLQGPLLFLRAGVGDHGFEMGRRPGLLTDTGSSNALMPALTIFAAFVVQRAANLPRKLTPIVRTTALALLFLAPVLYFQGKGSILSAAGIMIVWPLIFLPEFRMRSVLLSGLAAAVFGFLLSIIKLGPERVFSFFSPKMLQTLDPVRARLLEYSIEIFSKSPWTGHGLNSFVPQLMQLKAIHPEVYPENPPGLLPGILCDTGLVGLTLFAISLIAAALLLRRPLQSRTDDHDARMLVWLPVSLGPVFLVGYHVLFAEVSAFCLLPLLFCERTWSGKQH